MAVPYFDLKPGDDPGRLPLGSLFFWCGHMWFRRKGLLKRAHFGRPFMWKQWQHRQRKRTMTKTQYRFERKLRQQLERGR